MDVVFANLNIDIPRAPPVCKGGKKMNKANYRAMCAKAVKATTPIRVDILEVGKDKLSCQEFVQKLFYQ